MYRKAIRAAVAMGVVAILGSAALASAQPTSPNGRQIEVTNFNGFLDNHPQIAAELTKNPALVNDSDFLANHPPLKQFLDTHPAVRNDVQKAAGTIANRDGHYEWTRAMRPPGEAGRFYEGYLYKHPDVAHQIAANPSLLDSPQYVADHPGLQEYINTHPDIRTEMKRHPFAFDAGGRGRPGLGN